MKSYFLLITCGVTVACSTLANPPSLMPRAIEIRRDAPQTKPQIVELKKTDLALTARIKALLIEAKAGNADFTKAEAAGTTALASGRNASSGSEAWIAAELVKSALQVARQRSAAALAEIDTIAINLSELASLDTSIGDLPEVLKIQTEIETIVARQTTRLAVLSR